jgi:cyanophycinase
MPSTQTPKGRLLAIGGHEQREAAEENSSQADKSADFILQRFVDELAGQRTVVVIPTASEEAEEAGEDYVNPEPRPSEQPRSHRSHQPG